MDFDRTQESPLQPTASRKALGSSKGFAEALAEKNREWSRHWEKQWDYNFVDSLIHWFHPVQIIHALEGRYLPTFKPDDRLPSQPAEVWRAVEVQCRQWNKTVTTLHTCPSKAPWLHWIRAISGRISPTAASMLQTLSVSIKTCLKPGPKVWCFCLCTRVVYWSCLHDTLLSKLQNSHHWEYAGYLRIKGALHTLFLWYIYNYIYI